MRWNDCPPHWWMRCSKRQKHPILGNWSGNRCAYPAPDWTAGFYALDIDAESVAFAAKYPAQKEHIVLSDFLEADLATLGGDKFNIIGNFPYNISSQIMFKVLEERKTYWLCCRDVPERGGPAHCRKAGHKKHAAYLAYCFRPITILSICLPCMMSDV